MQRQLRYHRALKKLYNNLLSYHTDSEVRKLVHFGTKSRREGTVDILVRKDCSELDIYAVRTREGLGNSPRKLRQAMDFYKALGFKVNTYAFIPDPETKNEMPAHERYKIVKIPLDDRKYENPHQRKYCRPKEKRKAEEEIEKQIARVMGF